MKIKLVFLSAILANFLVFHYQDVAEVLTEVPAEVTKEAVNSGGISVFLFGTKEEKHSFGKGLPTRYGQMSFDIDHYLKYNKGWTEEKIHQVGSTYGFSEKRKQK